MRQVLLIAAIASLAACSPPAATSTEPLTSVHASAAPLTVDAPAGVYKMDKAHSSITFRLSHLGFSNYTAQFSKLDATLNFDPKNPTNSTLTATVDPRSLDLTGPPKGFVEELTGPNWLDAKKYPEIKFVSTGITMTAPDSAVIEGDLTLHGVTKPITLNAKFNGGYVGNMYDPNARIGFSINGVFKRSDFDIKVGIPAPGTNMGVFDDVNVAIETEMSGPKWEAPSATPQ